MKNTIHLFPIERKRDNNNCNSNSNSKSKSKSNSNSNMVVSKLKEVQDKIIYI